MASSSFQVGSWIRQAGDWLRRAEGWQLAVLAVVVLFALPILPALLILALLGAFVFFVRAWVREFAILMRLGDDVFPGHNDKLIWAILLIVLPPVGVWLFQSYREAHWPEAKPTRKPAAGPLDF